MRGTKDGGGWGCVVSVALVASASSKSAAMIGYLTPVTTSRISDDGLLLNLFSGETKASDGSRFIIDFFWGESRSNESIRSGEGGDGGGFNPLWICARAILELLCAGRVGRDVFFLAPNWHEANTLN